jgi:hypothetical protein
MQKLNWISDAELFAAVNTVLEKAKEAKSKATKKFGKNVIDPFSAIFEITGFEMSFDEWHKSETARQAQKTLQNHIGDFHQNILGNCKGWTNMNKGNVIDLVCNEKQIIAEVKNKYNTISGGLLSDLYTSLENLVMPKASMYKDFTAYYVTILPKNTTRFNKEFTPSNKNKGSKCTPNSLIRHIDGASFYDLVTQENNALEQLFTALPAVISQITNTPALNTKQIKNFFSSAYQAV